MIGLTLILMVIGAFAAFIVAAELVAKGTQRLEPVVGQGMAGGVVLGLVGAVPETMFVIIATLKGSYQIALGSAVGGNIILFTLGIGTVGILYAFKWKGPLPMKEDYHVESIFMLASTVAIALLLLYGTLDLVSGILISLVYVAYLLYRYVDSHAMISKKAATPEGRKLLLEGLALLAVGAIIVILLSNIFVDLITQLSMQLLVPVMWLALVIAPLATDLPENLGAYRITSKSSGGGSTAIVSFIGGKLQNNTVLLGLIGIIAASPVSLKSSKTAFIAVILVNIAALFAISRGRLSKRSSIALSLLYFAVVAATFLL